MHDLHSTYEMMNASPITLIVVVAALMVTPLHLFATFVMSGASARTGGVLASLFLVWGAVMAWVCLAQLPAKLGFAGNLVIPVCWATPSVLLVLFRRRVLARPLSQRWLVGLQLWRAIGAVFLIEMTRGNLPGTFAWPAGVGDVLVALIALAALLSARGGPVGRRWVLAVLIFGLTDFLSAFFFGFTSSEGPQQIFESDATGNPLTFPTGMIPLFLVPYAIFFHTLSWLELRRSGSQPAETA